MYVQGDIVMVNFPLPQGYALHPALLISHEEVFEAEGCYVAVMLTSSSIRDNFSFPIANEMLTQPLEKVSQVRCHLIALLSDREIERKVSKMKKEHLKKVIAQLNNEVLKVA